MVKLIFMTENLVQFIFLNNVFSPTDGLLEMLMIITSARNLCPKKILHMLLKYVIKKNHHSIKWNRITVTHGMFINTTQKKEINV